MRETVNSWLWASVWNVKPTMPLAVRMPVDPLTEADRAELDDLHRHGRKEVVDFRRKSATWLRRATLEDR